MKSTGKDKYSSSLLKEGKIKLMIEREKFNYGISKDFRLTIFNNYIVTIGSLIGFYIALIQIPVTSKISYILALTILLIFLITVFHIVYKISTKPIEFNLRKSAKIIDGLYDELLK